MEEELEAISGLSEERPPVPDKPGQSKQSGQHSRVGYYPLVYRVLHRLHIKCCHTYAQFSIAKVVDGVLISRLILCGRDSYPMGRTLRQPHCTTSYGRPWKRNNELITQSETHIIDSRCGRYGNKHRLMQLIISCTFS